MQSGTAGSHDAVNQCREQHSWLVVMSTRIQPGLSHSQIPTYKSPQMPFLASESYQMQERSPITCSWKYDGDKAYKYPEQSPQALVMDL